MRSTGPPDAALVAAARDGDKTSYATLVARHRPMVATLVRRMLRDQTLVEDAVQEAVFRAWRDLDRLRDPARFGPWLAGIGLNVSRGLLRAGPGAATAAALLGGIVEPPPAPDELVADAELADRVRDAVAALPDGQRAAVTGFYLDGLSQQEVAVALGTSTGAVKTRLHKARASLRRRLADTRLSDPLDKEQPVSTDVTMTVSDVRQIPGPGDTPDQYVIVLDERGQGDRRLPIWVGEGEAIALSLALQDFDSPRPMTYQLALRLLAQVGAAMTACHIHTLSDSTFFAVVRLNTADDGDVDARPSDALNFAVLSGAPITVDAQVLAQVGADPQARPAELDEPIADAAAIAERTVTQWQQALERFRRQRGEP